MTKQSKQSLFKKEVAQALRLDEAELGPKTRRGKTIVVELKRKRVTRYFAQRDAVTTSRRLFDAMALDEPVQVITYHENGYVLLEHTSRDLTARWPSPTTPFADCVKRYCAKYAEEGDRLPSRLARGLQALAAWLRRQRGK